MLCLLNTPFFSFSSQSTFDLCETVFSRHLIHLNLIPTSVLCYLLPTLLDNTSSLRSFLSLTVSLHRTMVSPPLHYHLGHLVFPLHTHSFFASYFHVSSSPLCRLLFYLSPSSLFRLVFSRLLLCWFPPLIFVSSPPCPRPSLILLLHVPLSSETYLSHCNTSSTDPNVPDDLSAYVCRALLQCKYYYPVFP